MMKIYEKKLLTVLSLLIILVVVSCVPAAKQKTAKCGANEEFSTITRSCYSIVEVRTVPVATLKTDSLSQETSKLVTLTYTDSNKDTAISCRVTGATAEIETISPVLFDGRLVSGVDSLYSAISTLSTNLTTTGAPNAAAVALALAQAAIYRDTLKKSFIHQTVLDNMINFRVTAEGMLTLATDAYNANIYPTVMSAYSLTTTRLADFVSLSDSMSNHCVCSGGVCTTYVIPKIRKNGAAGFNYSVTDVDGESALKSVALTIQAMSFASAPQYAPTAQGSAAVVTLTESANSTPISLAFQLPQVYGDYFPSIGYTYYVSSNPSKGTVFCNLLGQCTYTPNNGDENSTSPVVLPAAATASAVVSGITYTAKAIGTLGNNITVNFYDLHSNNVYVDAKSSSIENFGLVNNNAYEGYVRVIGSTINVFVNPTFTTLSQVVALINDDAKASKLVTAAGIGGAAIGVLPTNAVLSGGVDDYDKFSYYVNNGYANSAPVEVIVHINATDDAPYEVTPGTVATNPTTLLEDGGAFTVNLTSTYADVESNVEACRLDATDTNVGTNFTETVPGSACTCALGVCQLSLTANPNVHGTFSFKYQVESVAGSGNWSPTITRSITLSPVNDFPFIASATFTETDHTGTVVATVTNPENNLVAPATYPVYTTPTSATVAQITGTLTAVSMSESTSTFETTATYVLTTTPGGVATEGTQTVTISSVTSSNPTLVTPTVSGNTITFAPTFNQSGTATITITLTDDGGTTDGGINTSVQTVLLTVNPVNDYPYFATSNCNFNRRTNATAYCSNGTNVINCVGTASPVGSITASAVGVFYWDAENSRCYKSTAANSDSAWLDEAMTPTLVETNEGGEAQIEFTIDEDMGSTTDENAQGLTLFNVTYDNPSLIDQFGINAFYDLNDNGIQDSGEERTTNDPLEAAASNDSKLHKLYLKLKPFGGVSGNTNITVTIKDDDAADPRATSKTFSFVVHPIAALHGGWANIGAAGIKTDKNGAPVNVDDMKCDYNKTTDFYACADASGATQNCTGTASPHSVIIPKAENVIFWDSANKKCYRAQGPTIDKFSWIEMKTFCPITRFTASTCPITKPEWSTATAPSATTSGEYYYNTTTGLCYISSAAGTASWSAVPANWISSSMPRPTAIGQYYYDPASKVCYMSTTADPAENLVDMWTAYTPSKVTLAWNAFNMSGTGADANVQIAGWNVYRREVNEDYDFINGFLKTATSSSKMTIVGSGTRTFTDTTAIAGRVYFYTVRPVDNTVRNVATYTPEIYTEVRTIAPPPNYSFIHRWTINQEMCNSMNMTTETANRVDPTHNYRCPYAGPGEFIDTTVTPNKHYYDYGRDLLVDISEAGCPYSDATVSGCGMNGCVGIGAPTATVAAGGIYYDRNSGICYESAGGGAWSRYTGATVLANSNSALNPPLTNISETEAASACTARAVPTVTNATVGAVILPEKKDYMAFSAPPTGLNDTEISDLEQGYSLDVESRCNASSADGIQHGFTDATIPSTSYLYSLPGTASSGIRSVVTGSVAVPGITAGTGGCVSRYGVQDVYGNVAEWVRDSMTCYGGAAFTPNLPYSCMATGTTEMASYVFGHVIDSGTPGVFASYGFDYRSGPFYDLNSSILGPDSLDGFITEWTFIDRLFSAGYFSFPLGLPINTDIASMVEYGDFGGTIYEAPTLLEIGPQITTYQLHGDGVILNGANTVYEAGTASQAANTITGVGTSWTAAMVGRQFIFADGTSAGAITGFTSATSLTVSTNQAVAVQGYMILRPGNFAVGGGYLSGLRAGRFTMELIPSDTIDRKDVGFRCVAPINGYAPDSKHTYSY